MRATSLEPPAVNSSTTEDPGLGDAGLCSPSERESSLDPSLQDVMSLSSDHGEKAADSVSARSVRSSFHVALYICTPDIL